MLHLEDCQIRSLIVQNMRVVMGLFMHSQSGVWKPSESLGQMKGGDVTQVARAEGRQLQVPEALISVCSLGDVL